LADEPLAGFRKRNYRWSRARTLRIWDHDRFATFHDGHTGVRGAKIDA